MSLVTTAKLISCPRARHRAAVVAVLPLPTGPPMPSRNGRSWRGLAGCGSGSAAVGPKLTGGWWPWPCSSGRRETHLLPVVVGVCFGEQVERGWAGGGQVGRCCSRGGGGLVGDPVQFLGQPGDRGVDVERVQPEQPHRGGRGPADGQVAGGQGGFSRLGTAHGG